ncbi:MAG: peptidylprolyl isomerase [Acidimicrobiales bacterium]
MGTDKRERQKQGRQERLAEKQAAEARAKQRKTIIRVGVLAAIAAIIIVLFVTLGGDDSDDSLVGGDTSTTTTTAPPELVLEPFVDSDYGEGECAPVDGVDEPVTTFDDAPALCIDPTETYVATFATTAGDIVVELTAADTPGTVNNFVNLARYGYYDDTLVHRADDSIGILQGGAPTTNSAADPGPGYTIRDEGAGFTYEAGQIAMANRGPDTAGGQWFFTVDENAALLDAQGAWTVFGEVTEGLDILVDVLATQVDDDSGLGGSPDPDVVVESVTITTPDGAGSPAES